MLRDMEPEPRSLYNGQNRLENNLFWYPAKI